MIWFKIFTKDTISQKRTFVKGIASRELNTRLLNCSSSISLPPLRRVCHHHLALRIVLVVHVSVIVFHKYFALAYKVV